MTPKQTITKARSVPIDTSSPRRPIGKKPATAAATTPVTIVVTYGVWNRGCTGPNTEACRPSCDIEREMRGFALSTTRTTDAERASALTVRRTHGERVCRAEESAVKIGCDMLTAVY